MPKAKKLPSGNWRVLAYIGKDENKKRKYKSFTASSRKEAEFLAADYLANNHEVDVCDLTVAEAVAGYIESKEHILSPSTIEGYRSVERHHLGMLQNILICQMATHDAQSYINELASTLSPKSVRNAWGLVASAILLQAPDKRFSVTMPAKKRIVRELPTVKEVVRAVQGTNAELPALLAIWLSLRMSEIRGIKYGDIINGVLTIRRAALTVRGNTIIREQTKTYGSTRRLRLPSHILKLIGQGSPDNFLFTQAALTIYKHFTAAIHAAGLPHMRFHDLRHLNASVMLQLGIPEKYAMERGGWATNSTLQNVYQHTFSAERAAVDEKIDAYFSNLVQPTTA